jgi:mevalonate kinase
MTKGEYIDNHKGVDLTVRSDIPVAAGLGSSAAICVATAAAVGELLNGGLSQQEICDIAYEGEKVVHGTPSGVDNNISGSISMEGSPWSSGTQGGSARPGGSSPG